MPAPSINTAKELAQPAHRPLLLAVFTFRDGSVYRAATMPVTFGGYAYEARIDQQEIDRLSVLSEQGVDRIPSVTLRLADPDAFLYLSYERAAGKGFLGASLSLTFAMYDVVAGEWSTDSFVPFAGICDKPALDEKVLTVSAASKLNLTRYSLPTALIQPQRCMWINPTTAAQRAEADNPESRFYFCGETRSTSAAPPCSYTKPTCTQPSRFSGLTWEPEKAASGKQYISGNKVEWRNADTSGKFKAYVPLWLGGTCWLEGVVANTFADGNYTRAEVIIGMGAIDVERVIVNGVELSMSRSGDFRWHYVNQGSRNGQPNTDVPYKGTGDGYPSQTAIQVLATHAVISPDSLPSVRVLGRRKLLRVYRRVVSVAGGVVQFDGVNQDCAGNPPFAVTISGNSNPALNGTFTLTNWAYGPPGTITLNGTTASGTGGWCSYEGMGGVLSSWGGTSTVWALMEALRWARFGYDEISLLSWADCAKIANADFTYTDQNGNSATQPRFSTAMVLREKRSAADVVRGLRQSAGLMLVPESTGLLGLLIEGPLAEQQPAPVNGSNYNTPVSSILRDGSTANGYLAYLFDDSNSKNVTIESRSLSDMPNRVSFAFSDPANGHALSTFALVDPDAVARVGQEIPGGLQVEPEGIASHNHALRCGKLGLAKIHRGNPAGDARGTDLIKIPSSFRGCRLRVGQIIGVTNARLNLTRQLVRITGIKPDRNFEEMTVTGHLHYDSWYLDSNGSSADPSYSSGRELRRGLPAPWHPRQVAPTATGNAAYDTPGSLFDATDYSFAVRQIADISADGKVESRLEITGKAPVTSVSALSTPLLARQGTTTTTGGAIPGAAGIAGGVRRLYVAVCAKEASGLRTPMSEPCFIDITATTNTNAVSVPIASWDPDTSGYAVYAGWSPMEMSLAASGSGKPASVTLTSIPLRGEAPPDVLGARLKIEARETLHSGVAANFITAVGASSITSPAFIGADNFAGRDASVIGDASDGAPGVWNFRITAHNLSTGVLTVVPSPSSVGVGDVIVIRARATTASSNTIGDAGYVNAQNPSGVPSRVDSVVRIIAGKGRGQERRIVSNTSTVLTVEPAWDEVPDSTSTFVILAPEGQFTAETALPQNSDPNAQITAALNINNKVNAILFLRATVLDADGRESADRLSPTREVWLFGQPPVVRTITADYTITRQDRTILVDTSAGNVTVTLLPSAQMEGLEIVVKRITGGSNTCTIAAAVGESIDGASTVSLAIQWDSMQITAVK